MHAQFCKQNYFTGLKKGKTKINEVGVFIRRHFKKQKESSERTKINEIKTQQTCHICQ